MSRLIFHADVNSAFLSWTAVKRLKENPDDVDLRTIPSAIGGSVDDRHGIITAKSIPAKKYGIVTGEPVVKALQKCPNLVLAKGDFKIYREFSRLFISILKRFSNSVEQVSIDEAFIDMTGFWEKKRNEIKHFDEYQNANDKEKYLEESLKESAIKEAEKIKETVFTELGFTINVGISTNKLLAKMASDFEKPYKVHTLFRNEIQEKMWPLPIGNLFGCGKQTAARLNSLGLRTIGEVARENEELLCTILGEKSGEYIHESSNGYGSDKVEPQKEDAKGYSNETTTRFDITFENYEREIDKTLQYLCESVSRRLQRDSVFAGTIGVSVKTDLFQRRSKQLKLSDSTNDYENILAISKKLMNELLLGENGLFSQGYKVRLVGVSATNLDDGQYRQMNLFDMMTDTKSEDTKRFDKMQKLKQMSSEINSKFGDKSIYKGKDFFT